MDLKKWMDRAQRLLRSEGGPLGDALGRVDAGFGLGQVPKHRSPDATTTSVCGYCATGCGLRMHMKDGSAVSLSPDTSYPVNLGMACPKGWEALAPLASKDRATTPLLRGASGRLEPVSWDEAMRVMQARLGQIQRRHGPESLAFLSTGQIPTEEMVLLGALAKFGMGMVHGDGNTRQCMASSVAAYKECFGFDAPPYSYSDFEESDVIVLVGSNLCIAHPILWERICRNPNQPEIIVVDPRRSETAMAATQHLPIAPKSDLLLFYSVAQVLIERDWIDHDYIRAHTQDFDAFAAHVARFEPRDVARSVGVPAAAIEKLAETIHRGERVSIWWTMGVNQGHEAVRTAQALIALALMTGNIGRPGSGANSITGQCNAMGSRLFSNTTNLFAGRSFDVPADRAEVARILGIEAERIPDRNSLAYDQILEAIDRGRIRGLWLIATNGSHSWIDQQAFGRALDKLDFLVVQDMYADTETAQRADLVLPAAGWGEKEGTFINSERRIGITKKVRRAPGQALADFHIFRLVADSWGCSELFDRWKTPEDVFDTMKELSRGRPCDFSGIEGYRMLEAAGGIQWPHPTSATPPAARRRLFEDGHYYFPNARARFVFDEPRPVPEPVCSSYPLVLLTGRGSSSQWHTQTRTARSPVLRKLAPEAAWVEIHPEDAEASGIVADEIVRVASRRGSTTARAVVRATVGRGRVFIPMHYASTNRLTIPSFDPQSRQPSYKHCAVRIDRIDKSIR
ncbi:MAG: nitrate reductase [Deltaproteobacteria bacterium]|nr:nitrate reductase [Deltaproteobacteria bacterium]